MNIFYIFITKISILFVEVFDPLALILGIDRRDVNAVRALLSGKRSRNFLQLVQIVNDR